MASCLKRYWFEFDFPKPRFSHYGYIPADGCCGITAFNYNDALKIMRRFMLRENETPLFSRVIEDVDVSAIENEQVHRNLGVPVWRGVWYPDYNLWQGAYFET
jgi:hypothetical protein